MSGGRRVPRGEAGTGYRLRVFFERAAAEALEEDLGGGGPEADVTSTAVVPAELYGEGLVVAKAPGVVCGLEVLEAVVNGVERGTVVRHERVDGDAVAPEDVLARVEGRVRALLTAERTALNLLGHLSGVATLTRAFVERAPGVEITDTRKTLPGMRVIEKYAVRAGGGTNHRFSLWDGILVKDNHIGAAGGVEEAVRRAKRGAALPVQVECETAQDIDEALAAGADALLIDNVEGGRLSELVARARKVQPDVLIEASGGITLAEVGAVAATGVDRISVGALTHSAPALDLSFRLERTWGAGT